jgi:hypothetical protein
MGRYETLKLTETNLSVVWEISYPLSLQFPKTEPE